MATEMMSPDSIVAIGSTSNMSIKVHRMRYTTWDPTRGRWVVRVTDGKHRWERPLCHQMLPLTVWQGPWRKAA